MPDLKLRRPAQLQHISFNHLLPNAITLLSLCSGLTAIRYALLERWEFALFALMVAAICDTLDGRVARMLKGTSQFGAELDSLADLVSFGVAPALILYLWTLNGAGPLGWVAVLIFPCCSALRLARFNTALADQNPPPFASMFFTGVPTPAGAGLAVLPIVLSIGMAENRLGTLAPEHWLVIPWTILVGLLMVSRLPTFSGKKVKIPRDLAVILLLGVALFTALIVTRPWVAMVIILTGYMLTLPFSYLYYRSLMKAYKANKPA